MEGLSLKFAIKRPIHTQKRPIHTPKTPIHTQKRSIHTPKTPVHTQKRPADGGPAPQICHPTPYSNAKET